MKKQVKSVDHNFFLAEKNEWNQKVVKKLKKVQVIEAEVEEHKEIDYPVLGLDRVLLLA